MTGTFRGAWRHRRWRWLLASYAVSTTGDFLYFVALIVLLYDATGSAGWVAASAVARMLAYVFLSPFGGVVADRFDRLRLLIWLDVARAAVMVVLAVVAWTDGRRRWPSRWPSPARSPRCRTGRRPSPPRRRWWARTTSPPPTRLESVVAQVSYFAGPALGALVVAVTDPGTAFAANAVTFLVSAALVLKAGPMGGGRRRRGRVHGEAGAGRRRWRSWWSRRFARACGAAW